jgi:hypothetical protein
MNTPINQQIATLIKESGCNIYCNGMKSGISWNAHECQIIDDSAYPYKSQSRMGTGETPEQAIAACKAASFTINTEAAK